METCPRTPKIYSHFQLRWQQSCASFLPITFDTSVWKFPPQRCKRLIVALPQPQSGLRRREPPAETACRTVPAWWRGRCVRNGAENTCGSLLVLVSPLVGSFNGRAPAVRWAASLSKPIWGSDQCHLVLRLAAPHPLPKRPPSPIQTDSTLLLQTFCLFSVSSANTLPKFLFVVEDLSRNLVFQAPPPTPLCSGEGAFLQDCAQTQTRGRCK